MLVQNSYQAHWPTGLDSIRTALDTIGLGLGLAALALSLTALDVAVLRFSISDDWETILCRIGHCTDLIDSVVRLASAVTIIRRAVHPRTVLLVMVLYDVLKRFARAEF